MSIKTIFLSAEFNIKTITNLTSSRFIIIRVIFVNLQGQTTDIFIGSGYQIKT